MSDACLLDSNLLIALVIRDHLHNDAAVDWFVSGTGTIVTCPITEGSLIRFLVREGYEVAPAVGVLDALRANERHEFWPDDVPLTIEMMGGVVGHRQVTDAYLVGLARSRSARLATFDRGLAALHGSSHVELLSP